MTLEELEKVIKSYNCAELRKKDVCEAFLDNNACGYIADIENFKFDATHGRFIITFKNEKPAKVGESVLI